MKRGFTLVELLIVMVVMAILVSIALPTRGMREEADITKAKGETRALKTAIESYLMHHSDTCPASSSTPYASYLDADSVNPGPQLIETVLYDPFDSTNEYYYLRGTSGDYYAVCSKGPDGTADLTAAEVNDGEITAAEIDDDICASNAKLP